MKLSDAIKGNLNTITSNPIASTILKWLRFKLLRQVQITYQSAFGSQWLSLITSVVRPRNVLLPNNVIRVCQSCNNDTC
jgi:hypothetical protein